MLKPREHVIKDLTLIIASFFATLAMNVSVVGCTPPGPYQQMTIPVVSFYLLTLHKNHNLNGHERIVKEDSFCALDSKATAGEY